MGIAAESVSAIGMDGQHPEAALPRDFPGANQIGIHALGLERLHIGGGARPHGVLRQIARVRAGVRNGSLTPAITAPRDVAEFLLRDLVVD